MDATGRENNPGTEATEGTEGTEAAEGTAEHRVRVLLVDDQRIIAEAVHRLLHGQTDIDFHWTPSGTQALVEALKWKPTVVLQDLVMPDIDGFEVVQQFRLHEDMQHVPIIVLTSRDDPQLKAQGFATGANDYLVKLPDRLELLARLRYHSAAYVRLLERNEAFRALRESKQQLALANIKLQQLADIDGLTNLANRRRFDSVLQNEWLRAQRSQQTLSLLMCDIDFFKLFNDSHGHLAGDECLKKVAAVLGSNMRRPGDLAARYGGEEFALVLPDTDTEGAMAIAEMCRQQIEALALPNQPDRHVTMSIGVASMVPTANAVPLDLIDHADRALYQAKGGGRNRVAQATMVDACDLG